MEIVTRPLDPLKSIDHLTGTLEYIAVLDSETANHLRNGSMVALVPPSASAERMHDFRHAGLLPRRPAISMGSFSMEPVSSSAPNLASELCQLHDFDCLIHDPLQKIEEASAQDGPPLLIDNALFYLDRYCLRSEADCERAIRRNTYSWHFLLLVGTYPIEAKHTLKSIVQQAKCIVVGAYDGESYLIWRPSSDANQPQLS